MSLPRNHVSLEGAEDVKIICKPLFSKTKINYFSYCRLYDNGNLAHLSTRPDFHRFFWDNGFEVALSDYKEGISFNNQNSNLAKIEVIAKHDFDMDNILGRVKRVGDYLEIASFATPRGKNSIIDYYLKYQNELDEFVLYFKFVAKKLIQNIDSNLLHVQSYKPCRMMRAESKVIDDLRVKKYHMYNSFIKQHLYISYKQYILLKRLAMGFTCKEIANMAYLTTRTVETNVTNLKHALNCQNKFQLVKIFHENFN